MCIRDRAIQCLIRGYGLLDDKESSEKVLNLVEEGLKTDYLNDSAKRELLQYQASALEKEEKKETVESEMNAEVKKQHKLFGLFI